MPAEAGSVAPRRWAEPVASGGRAGGRMRRARHKRRGPQHGMRTVGVAALLPALFLAALYVAAPFAGTTTHAISQVAPAQAPPAAQPAPARQAQLMRWPCAHGDLRRAR